MGLEQDGFGPAATRTQNITVGKSPADGQHIELGELCRRCNQLTHMHIHRSKSRPVERRRHFEVAVDPLLAQDGNLWLGTRVDEGCTYIQCWIEAQRRTETRVSCGDLGIFAISTGRVIPQTLHLITGLSPLLLQGGAVTRHYELTRVTQANGLLSDRATDFLHAKAPRANRINDARHLAIRNLHQHAQLFIEIGRKRRRLRCI